MNLLLPQVFKTRFAQGCQRIAGAFLALLCVVSFIAVPAFAEPVRLNQVIQTISSSQGTPDLKLNSLVSQQDPNGQKGSTQTGPRNDNGTTAPKTDSITSGVVVTGEGQRLGVEVFEEAEVEGTICDCGELLIAGGIPKWPFLFLAAVPLVFIHDCDDCDTPDDETTPTPTPTPTPTSTPTPTPPPQVPEPASLVLLGTGLMAFGAGLRRRYSKTKAVEQLEGEE